MYLVVSYDTLMLLKALFSVRFLCYSVSIELHGSCAFTKINLGSYLYNKTIP